MRNIAFSVGMLLATLFSTSVYADKAIFAGGCFWCVEKDFESLDGVSEAVSGFIGGTAPNPTYRGDHTGHYEAVEITYDPAIVSYQELLDHFWVNHDPFDAIGQFCDKGSEYLAADQTVVTPILNATTFYPITGNEIHHQDFYKKSPVRYNTYRWGCGRDKRLKAIWGEDATV